MTSHWRQHWADRENARREAEYGKAALAWQQDLEQIRRYHRLSITAGPAINTSGIRLHHGENLWWTTTGATLVEMPDTVKLKTPDHHAYSPTAAGEPPLPRGTLRDNGCAVITNQRVIFFGELSQYDWCFSQLTGVAHGVKETVLRVENRRTLCGLGVAPALAAGFRFHLAVALAEHGDDREGFTDYLVRLLDRQQLHGPQLPSPAVAGDAPHPLHWALRLGLGLGRRLYFGRPGASAARQVVPALATAVLLACGLGLAAVPNIGGQPGDNVNGWRPPHQGEAAPTATPFGTPVGMPVGPLGPDSPQKEQSGRKEVPPQNGSSAVQPATPSPEPPPSNAPPSVNLCGAPPNPWNFQLCGSGALIDNPPEQFCGYFPCADGFWRNTNGFVVECEDGLFSQTGGRPGACLHHGGPRRALRR